MDHNNFDIKYDVIKPIIQFFKKYGINIDSKMDSLKMVDPEIFNEGLNSNLENSELENQDTANIEIIRRNSQITIGS